MTSTATPQAVALERIESIEAIDSQDFPNRRPDRTPDLASVLHLRVNGLLHVANRGPLKHRLLDELDAGRRAIVPGGSERAE